MCSYKFQNTKLIKVITSKKEEYKNVNPFEGVLVRTCSKDKIGTKEETMTYCVFDWADQSFDDGEGMTWFDRIVMDAVFSIWIEKRNKSGVCAMSYLDIYRAASGKEVYQCNKGVEAKIEKSVLKLMHLNVNINVSHESNSVKKFVRKYGQKENILSSRAIKAVECDVRVKNGKLIKGIEVVECPILWTYAEAMNRQYLSVQRELIDVPELYFTETMASIRNLLILHVRSIRAGHIKSRKISVKKLLGDAGMNLDDCTRADMARMRTTIKKILDHFIEMGLIKGYYFENKNKVLRFDI